MASQQNIQTALGLANSYYHLLWQADLANASAGFPVRNNKKINCLNYLIQALTFDYNGPYNDATTTVIYEELLTEIAPYSGGITPYDPEAVVPGQVIVVVNSIGYIPPIPNIPFDSFDPGTEQPDNGRYIYYNSAWKGLNPVLSLTSPSETALNINVDYVLVPAGGISLLPGSQVLPFIYEGQSIRSTGYALPS